MAEIFVCMIMGYLAGKKTIRSIVRWSRCNLAVLRRYMPFPHGVPSLSTISRVLASVDEDMVAYTFMNWIGEITNTRGTHIAIDGKGLRAATNKMREARTPYILNAIDVATKLVIGQLAISEKTNEMTAIPELIEMLEISGSTITTDAIGATERIMNTICGMDADFVLQVKGNCPALYTELNNLFTGLSEDKKADEESFREKYGDNYSEFYAPEKNRDRYEYRKCQSYSVPDGMKSFQEDRPHVVCVGFLSQTRIMQIKDESGTDVTPDLAEFIENGSSRQPKKSDGNEEYNGRNRSGLIASKKLDAKQLMEYKRKHWAIENSLHYVLDEQFGEDKSTIRQGKNTASILRKCAYNIARLLQMERKKDREYIPNIIDEVSGDLEIGLRMLFSAIPSHY